MYLFITVDGKRKQFGPLKSLHFSRDGEIRGPGIHVKKHPVWGSWSVETDNQGKFYFDPDSLEIGAEPLVS